MDSSLIGILVNGVSGGVVVVLIILGYLVPKPTHTRVLEDSARKDETIDKLTQALALERQRSNDATQAGAVTNQLIGALTNLAGEHRAAEKHEHQQAADAATAARDPLELTGTDLGL